MLLAPEPRPAIKHALAELRQESGDIRALEGNLAGYYRLRGGRHRIVFSYAADGAIEANRLRTAKVTEKIARLRPLPAQRYPETEQIGVSVSSGSTVRVKQQTYSVPSQLIGFELDAHVSENQIRFPGKKSIREEEARQKNRTWAKSSLGVIKAG